MLALLVFYNMKVLIKLVVLQDFELTMIVEAQKNSRPWFDVLQNSWTGYEYVISHSDYIAASKSNVANRSIYY